MVDFDILINSTLTHIRRRQPVVLSAVPSSTDSDRVAMLRERFWILLSSLQIFYFHNLIFFRFATVNSRWTLFFYSITSPTWTCRKIWIPESVKSNRASHDPSDIPDRVSRSRHDAGPLCVPYDSPSRVAQTHQAWRTLAWARRRFHYGWRVFRRLHRLLATCTGDRLCPRDWWSLRWARMQSFAMSRVCCRVWLVCQWSHRRL